MTRRATGASGVAVSGIRPRSRPAVRRSSFKKRVKTFFALVFLLIETGIALALVITLAFFYRYSSTELPAVESLFLDIRAPVATTIWSQDGVQLGQLESENRQPVTLDEIPKNLINATIAIEDHRFFEHPGIDPLGVARAAVRNVQGNNLGQQGGSTLTQQLVRNLPQFGLSKEKKLPRKIREALIAMRMEQIYSKNEILQLYLNNIYYGGGAYGIQAAARTFFGKSAYKLDLAEAALLAGLPQRPSVFSPFSNREATLRRRDEVLTRMREEGFITDAQLKQAKAAKPRLMPRRERKNFDFKAPYFVTYALRDLIQRYGADFLYSGLKIETTLNWQMQQAAEKALEEGLKRADGRQANQGALVSLDNNTGYIRALVGGRSFRADQYNAVTQGRRQPGSTFKLFVYASAFDTETANLRSGYRDATFYYPGDPKRRYVAGSGKTMDLLSAIKYSKNAVAVRVAEKVGMPAILEYATKMGITTPLDPLLPTALGASSVRPLDLCSAYSVVPMRGDRCLPMAIVRVTDTEGNVIEEHVPQKKTGVLRPETAEQLDKAFEAVVNGGTGARARGTEANGLVENARGKTGTTNSNRDVWFAGYTPELTTVIWVASVHRSGRKLTYRQMPGAFGGVVAAPIWHDFMVEAVPIQRRFRLNQEVKSSAITVSDSKPKTEKKPEQRQKQDEEEVRPTPEEEAADTTEDANLPPAPEENAYEAPATAPPATALPVEPSPRAPAPSTSAPVGSPLPAESAGRGRATAPEPPPVRVSAPRPAEPEMKTVSICVDSGNLATSWCDATKTVRVTARQAARLRRCRQHRPPPGEE